MTGVQATFVLGTRPEIIKLTPVIRECERRGIEFTTIHTGQHYSDRLDAVFFRQLDLPKPTCNLAVGSSTHGQQTGKMLADVEERLLTDEPDVVFVQGDTNSALAGALAGAKLDAEVAHVEAGLRSFDREMPEEVNRVLIDHAADQLLAPTDGTADLLRQEGLPEDRITVTGNTIADAVHMYADLAAEKSDVIETMDLAPDKFCLLTAHREENVDNPDRFASLLEAVDRYARRSDSTVVYPIHPRARERLNEFGLTVPGSIRIVEPQDFLDFLRLESKATLALTDSGGVQEETCILGTPCVTLRYSTERPETTFVGANCVAGLVPEDIVAAAERMATKDGDWSSPFGDGRAAKRILDSVLPQTRSVPTP